MMLNSVLRRPYWHARKLKISTTISLMGISDDLFFRGPALFACTNSPSKTLNIQGIGAVHAINALSVDLYADWNTTTPGRSEDRRGYADQVPIVIVA